MKESLMEINGKKIEARTIASITQLIRGVEITNRKSVLEKEIGKQEISDNPKRIKVKIDHAKNIMEIEDYNKNYKIGKYWDKDYVLSKIRDHYTSSEIEEQSEKLKMKRYSQWTNQ